MNIPKAIEILAANKKELLICSIADLRAAQQLGIEALKTIKAERTIYGFKRLFPLPGETEE